MKIIYICLVSTLLLLYIRILVLEIRFDTKSGYLEPILGLLCVCYNFNQELENLLTKLSHCPFKWLFKNGLINHLPGRIDCKLGGSSLWPSPYWLGEIAVNQQQLSLKI